VEDFETLSENLARLTNECERLRQENSRLYALLNQPVHSAGAVDKPTILAETAKPELSVSEKITLFRSLFRGRDDIYAVRWEGANGKSGYSPASLKDWDALRLVPRSEWKKRDKETRKLLPLTDEAAHNHLSGKITIGVYPLWPDETCWFLAVDFDQQMW
jgi:hypothetical protein